MRFPTSRRGILAAAALAATLALAACGSATDEATTPGSGPARIRIAAGGGAAGLTAAGSERAADSKIAGGMVPSIGFAPTEWIVEGTLPELDGEAKAWVYPAKPAVSTEDIAAIAKALGVEGDVVAVPEDQGGGWLVGSADYTGPRLTVDRTGMGSWYYDSAAYARVRSACVAAAAEPAPVAPDATVSPDPSTAAGGGSAGSDGGSGTEPAAPAVECPEPTPPANVPSADEARTKALALAKALGQSPAAADLRVEGDEWGRYVTWSSSLDGVPNPAVWSAVYGAEGELVSASGTLVEPQAAAPYPRIGTAKALELLKSGQGWFGAWPAVAVAGDGSAAATVGIGADAPTEPAVSEPAPMPPMEPYKVTITGVEAALTMLYAVEGDVWLVPAYRFVNADGEVALVPAIDSSYVEEAAPAGDPGIGVGGVPVGSSVGGSDGGAADSPGIAPTATPAVEVTAAKP